MGVFGETSCREMKLSTVLVLTFLALLLIQETEAGRKKKLGRKCKKHGDCKSGSCCGTKKSNLIRRCRECCGSEDCPLGSYCPDGKCVIDNRPKPDNDGSKSSKAGNGSNGAGNGTDIGGKIDYGKCGEGWVEMVNSCPGQKKEDILCAKIGKPLQYVSWLHFQYVCDDIGGRLPEPTDANMGLFDLLLKSYNEMYGKTVMFLGATDVTHTNNWQWMSSQTPLVGAKDKTKWAGALPSVKDNKDCLAQDSTTGKWINVDCEDDNLEALIANLCVKQA